MCDSISLLFTASATYIHSFIYRCLRINFSYYKLHYMWPSIHAKDMLLAINTSCLMFFTDDIY